MRGNLNQSFLFVFGAKIVKRKKSHEWTDFFIEIQSQIT
ncbi:hypothetical protein FEM21_22350 [Flavobacterium seoulense]|uniref:Transposase n=1 Tax=Flavobacterium seoulense TaxID=1492738 RepID=A0A066WKH9_9FLAO|nr:hypothetical protein FEM21_22350 [Flavobacterium seoulense]